MLVANKEIQANQTNIKKTKNLSAMIHLCFKNDLGAV